MGSKARKAKNPIGCLADRCKSGVPINMVWWNRVTENNLQVKIIFIRHFFLKVILTFFLYLWVGGYEKIGCPI